MITKTYVTTLESLNKYYLRGLLSYEEFKAAKNRAHWEFKIAINRMMFGW